MNERVSYGSRLSPLIYPKCLCWINIAKKLISSWDSSAQNAAALSTKQTHSWPE